MQTAGDFANVDQIYEDIVDMVKFKKKMIDILIEYNNSPGVVAMDLVLFKDAISHGLSPVSFLFISQY